MADKDTGKDADESNIISLEERLRAKSAQRQPVAGEEKPSTAGEQGAQSGTTAAGESAEALEPLPGKLVWLHCPACGTMEYTELLVPGGRAHNVCGMQVEEAVLDIDVRAEYTLATFNLERLQAAAQLVEAQRARYEEYQERLRLIAGEAPPTYPLSEETLKRLPVAQLDPLGLLVPEALHDPARHFADPAREAASADSADAPDASDVSGSISPHPDAPPDSPSEEIPPANKPPSES